MSLRLLIAVMLAGPAWAELQIRPGKGVVEVSSGGAHWVLATDRFDVIHSATLNGGERLGPGRAGVEALGGGVTFGAPSEVKSGGDWVELRGWASREKNLWYVARYQFYGDKPFVRLVVTLTDRHDKSPADEPWMPYWQNRQWSKWRLEIGAPGGKPSSVTQHNSYSFSSPGEPWVEVVNASGAPYQWASHNPPLDPARFQISHGAKDGANQVIWHPMFEGTAELAAVITGFSGGAYYKAAKSDVYEIVDAAGQTHSVKGDQSSSTIKLGTFALNRQSLVRLKALGGGEEVVIAGTLRVEPQKGRAFDIKLAARHDGVVSDGPLTMAVKDFWQHHPMTLFRTDKSIGWQAIETPELYTGGMGLTIETLISLEGPAAAASAALYAPPKRELPPKHHPVDGSLAKNPRYDALIKLFAERFWGDLENQDSFGWRNWGDYQIGVSYMGNNGPTEDWANLQYDLPNGLLMAWMRTGDPSLWHMAQASIRHLMDMDLVKFHPFMDKLDGLVYRKGEMTRAHSHTGAEPITDQGFAFRSLLLYYHLTGEQWALDLAKQNIDRLVYYAVTRPQFVLFGDRPTGWMLRAALAGAEYFPDDPNNHYQAVADKIVQQLLDYYKSNKRLPGMQAVWQGQMVEGLAEYHRRTGRADVAEMITGHVRHLLTDCTRKKPDGNYEFMYCFTPNGGDCATPQWAPEENYLFLWLSGIAYAAQLSHDPFFSKWADTLFSYGEGKMREHHDIRSWTSVLAYPFLYLETRP